MTRQDLVDKICAKNEHLRRQDVEKVVKVIFDSISQALALGKSVSIRGLGTFIVKHRKARIGRNPKTGEFVEVPAKRVPFLKTGGKIHKLLNSNDNS